MILALVAALVLASTALIACSHTSLTQAQLAGLPTPVAQGAPPVVVPSLMPTLTIQPYQPTSAPAPTPTIQPVGPGGLAFPLRTQRLEFGAASHLFYTERYTPLTMAREAGFTWVRQQIHWKDQEGPAGNYVWGELESIINDVDAQGLKLLISIVQSPDFYTLNGGSGMPANPETLGNFVAALTERYKGKIGAIEIWNEQNLAYENGGQVSVKDAGHYVELLKAAYTRIKAVDPNVYVIAGPPASTAVNAPGVAVDDLSYFKAMYAYQNGIIRNYMDAQAVHPGGSANPPDTLWPDSPSAADGWTTDRTFYFRRVEDVRALMVEYGMERTPIWITEFGWATANSSPGFEFGNQVSYDQQAEYIVGAMRRTAEQYPWVGAMFLWNLNFAPIKAQQGEPTHEQASFSIVNGDYSPRPSYTAIQQYIAQLRASGR
ncbi:cellulase family glycosylhydrolase [Chloroflexia bacterium SDU3-3]|nr:cellulase family glycosylhydrolase [Chloroflexia bacterium SDU3-3]